MHLLNLLLLLVRLARVSVLSSGAYARRMDDAAAAAAAATADDDGAARSKYLLCKMAIVASELIAAALPGLLYRRDTGGVIVSLRECLKSCSRAADEEVKSGQRERAREI